MEGGTHLQMCSKCEDDEQTRERLIQELSEYERRFTSMLTNVRLCSVMLDAENRVIFVNNSLLELTGYTVEELLGKNYIDTLVPEEKRAQMASFYLEIIRELSDLRYIECDVVSKDGTRTAIGWNTTILKDGKNKVVGTSSIGEEVSNKVQTTAISTPAFASNDQSGVMGNNFIGETLGDYILVKSLGGENSNVKLAVHRTTKRKVAVKTLKKESMSEQELERAKREVAIMRKLTEVGNPFIIKLLDVLETPTEFNIFLEFISGGELVAFILKNKGLPEAHTHKLFLQVLSAIECCHKHNIIHRDIKLQNILLDENFNIKVIDFGLSNFMEEGVFRSTFCGTPAYASPEILLGTKYNGPEVDLWSLGVVLYSMLTAEFPFTTIGQILKGNFKEPEGVTEECLDLLRRVLMVDKDARESLVGVLNHPWVKMSSEEIEAKSAEAKKNRKPAVNDSADGEGHAERPHKKQRSNSNIQ